MLQAAQVITASFRLTVRDFFNALFWFNFRKFWFLIILLPVCATTAAFTSGGINVVMGLVFVSVLWGTLTFVGPYQGARASAKNRNFEGLLQYTFSESGIDVKATHSNAHLNWPLVSGVRESSAYVVFTLGPPNMLYLIPKSSLPSEDLKSLRKLLKSRVSGKIRLKK
jgi:hypothetical protein